MTPEQASEFARKSFEEKGVILGKEIPAFDLGDIYFRSGSSCHSRAFEGENYIHFHSGKEEWFDVPELKNAPETRIRRMTINGEDIPESECYPA